MEKKNICDYIRSFDVKIYGYFRKKSGYRRLGQIHFDH